VDFLLALIELFSLSVTAEVLRAKIDWKSALCQGVGQYPSNFHVERVSPANHFHTDI